LAVPPQNKGYGMQSVLGQTVSAELAIEQGVVRAQSFQQCLSTFSSKVIPAQVNVSDGSVVPKHVCQGSASVTSDLVVP